MSTPNGRVKRAAVACAALFFCLMLAGCWDIQEIKDQSFIIGIGVDKDENGIELSLLEVLTAVPSPKGEQNSTVSGNSNTLVISAKGPTLAYCIEVLRSEMDKRVTLSKVRFIVFGEELLKAGIMEHMDFLLRHNEIDKVTYVVAARPTAKELLTGEKGKLFSFLEIEYFSPLLHTVKMWELIPQLYTVREGTVLPLIRLGNEKIDIIGASLLRLDKQQFVIHEEKILWINILHKKNIKKMKILLRDELAFEIRKVKINMHVDPDKVVLKLKMNGWIVQSKILDPLHKKKQLERELSGHVTREMGEVLNESKMHGVDILGIGEKFRQKKWDTSDWENKLKRLKFEVKPDIRILSGYSESE